jgi:hypothetical protein
MPETKDGGFTIDDHTAGEDFMPYEDEEEEKMGTEKAEKGTPYSCDLFACGFATHDPEKLIHHLFAEALGLVDHADTAS